MSNTPVLCKPHRHISHLITCGKDISHHNNQISALDNEKVSKMEIDEDEETEECEKKPSKSPAKEEFSSCLSKCSPVPKPLSSDSRSQVSQRDISASSSATFIDVVNFLLVVQELLQNSPQQQDGQSQSVIILDTRENRLYQTSHVRRAFTTSCHSRMMAKRSIAFYAAMDPRNPGHKKIYLYDHKTTSQDGHNVLEGGSNLAFFINYLISLGNEVYVVDGGWWKLREYCQQNEALEEVFESCFEKELVDRYTCSPTNLESASEDVLNAVASRITDFLWLGNERDARDLELLQRCHITHVINVTNDVANFFEKNAKYCLKYCRLHASDNHLQDLIQHFSKAFDFIESARSQGGRVFVHCWAGVSRSPSIVAAYLMQREHFTPTEALEMIRQKRSIIAPNFNFLGQLERFYKSLRLQETSSSLVKLPSKVPGFCWLEAQESVSKGECSIVPVHEMSPSAVSEVFDGASSSSGYSSGLGESLGSMRSTGSHVESVDEAIGEIGDDLQHPLHSSVTFLPTDMRQSVKAGDRLLILPGAGLRCGFGSAPVSVNTYTTDCADNINPFRSRLAMFPPLLDLTSNEEDECEKGDEGSFLPAAHPQSSSLSAPVVKNKDQQQTFEQLLTKDKLLARSLSVNGMKKSEEMVPAVVAGSGHRNNPHQGFGFV